MSKNNTIEQEYEGLSRKTRVKLTLLCAAGMLFFFALFQIIANQYLHFVIDQSEKNSFIYKTENLKNKINAFFSYYGYNEIEQLRLHKNENNKLSFAYGNDILYMILADLNGFVIIHSDKNQEGSRIKLDNFKNENEKVKISSFKIHNKLQNIYNVTLPFVLNGSTQGVLKVGYIKHGPRVISFTEIIVRKAIKYTYVILLVFIIIAVSLIWLSSYFLEIRARKITEQQQLKNKRQLEIIGAGIVHEVKNALNGIKMNIQLLQEQLKTAAPNLYSHIAKNAERIHSEASRTSEMLNEFLTYTKPNRFNPKTINLKSLLEEIYQSFLQECKKRNINFSCECLPGITSVLADENQLRHAVTNLLWNAMEAVGENGKIILKGEINKNNINISVEDNGGGMDKKTEKKAFDVFYSTKPQGSGLGLSIVKKVATAHGGNVILKNMPNHGCKIILTFPKNAL